MNAPTRFLRAAALACAVGLSSCTLFTTNKSVQNDAVAPLPVVTGQASFDGNAQNSGVVDADASGFHVTDGYLARYDALLLVYGGTLFPPRPPGDRAGITPEPKGTADYAQGARWVFTAEAHSGFTHMNAQRTNNVPPPAKAAQGKPAP